MECPKCKCELEAKKAAEQKLDIDVCPECEGIWFDKKELEKMMPIARKKLKLHWKAAKQDYLCPRCRVELYEFTYPQTDVWVDMCKTCQGLWLDGGEFEAIEQARQALRQRGRLAEDDPYHTFSGSMRQFMTEFVELVVKVRR
ncbi:MAG: hypothetical protein AMJ79_04210 [Phycisphaerae bacterium SM23_30]|nr:MAG: hypothetical protein AMJ79_04210 [Phycisphaerae bacterium SM23_30]